MTYEYNSEIKPASKITADYNKKLVAAWDEKYKVQEDADVADVRRHLILKYRENEWNTSNERPDSVNPYLWQSKINSELAGVYKMAEDYYVVTGATVAEIALIKGTKGWVAIDAGSNEKEAELAIKLVEEATGKKIRGNIHYLLITHTHYDHFAGAGTFITEGQTLVYGPSDYEQSLVDDNLYAGDAMSRRLVYQSGLLLHGQNYEQAGCGVQKVFAQAGAVSTVIPDRFIECEETLCLDGVELTFVPAPDTETRAHMAIYDHTHKVLALGDLSMGTLHNTYTPRGARTRDAGFWGEIFYHLSHRFGDEAVAVFQGHGLPHFKRDDDPDHVKRYLLDNAAAYKFPCDQALFLANQGVKILDIGRKIQIPDEISKTWYTRDHYGNYTFNARGAVNRVLGFYDGNPVNLWPLEEKEYARKFVEYVGSEEDVLKKAEEDFEKGEYQWVANVTNYIVMSNPQNNKARQPCADALEQLGYQTHTGLWRHMYLTGALELRNPEKRKKSLHLMDNSQVIPYVGAKLLFDYIGIRFDGKNSMDIRERFIVHVLQKKNEEEDYLITIYKGTILYDRVSCNSEKKDLPLIALSNMQLYQLGSAQLDPDTVRGLSAEGRRILNLIQSRIVDTSASGNFNIIEPI